MLKTIKIKESTHNMLIGCGGKGETFDTIIRRLIVNQKVNINAKK